MDDGWRLSGESGHSSAAETIAHEDDRCRQETRQELAVCVYDAVTPALGAPAHLCSGATAAKVPAADDTHAAPRYLAPRLLPPPFQTMRAVWDAPSSQSSNSGGMPRGVGKNKSAPWSDRFRTVQSIAQRRLLKTTRAPLRVRLRGGGRLRSSFSSTMTTTAKKLCRPISAEQSEEAPAKVGLTGAP
jgi:hypothetical protein